MTEKAVEKVYTKGIENKHFPIKLKCLEMSISLASLKFVIISKTAHFYITYFLNTLCTNMITFDEACNFFIVGGVETWNS